MTTENTPKRPDLIAYAVTERGKEAEKKPFFHDIGAAWANSKGGYSLKLVSLPVNGEIALFPPRSTS